MIHKKENMNRQLKKTIKNIRRSGWRAYVVVFMMFTTYLILGVLMVAIFASQTLATYFIQKPEVIGFFNDNVKEEQILEMKNQLGGFDYVAGTRYVSKEEAMASFLEENKDKPEITEAITVNVFPAHLNVKANSLDDIGKVQAYFEQSNLISDVLASDDILGTLKKIVLGIQVIGLSLLLVFTISTIFIIFLTLGITIYSQKQEIVVAKLVGATDSYVRWPYIMQSLIFSLVAIVGSLIILIPLVAHYYNTTMKTLVGSLDVTKLSITYLLFGILIELTFGIALALASSFFATRRYIKT